MILHLNSTSAISLKVDNSGGRSPPRLLSSGSRLGVRNAEEFVSGSGEKKRRVSGSWAKKVPKERRRRC